MPYIFGHDYTPAELRACTSTLDQLAGIRLVEYTEGKARGMRAAEVWTGSGFNFTVWIDRAMDIGPAEYKGCPLAWLHPALGAPAFYEPEMRGWNRTFGGGLVTTGGLSHFGQPEESEGQKWGLHGRISHIPPTHVRTFAGWEGDDYILRIEGEVREAQIPSPNLVLYRRISTRLGASSLKIEDTVSNDSFVPVPHMMLYHVNFGFPVIAPGTKLEIDDLDILPRDPAAAAGLAEYAVYEPPDPKFQAQVFFHNPRPATDGFVTAWLRSPIGPDVYVRYRAAELPVMTQWKMTQAGVYVSAIEPCTTHEGPRSLRRSQGRLRDLAPGETVHYEIEIGAV
jgi:hypothetical protein